MISLEIDNSWDNPPKSFSLAENEIHLWLCKFDCFKTSIESFMPFLSDLQKEKASKFVFEKDRTSYIISNGLLRKLLTSYLNVPIKEITFLYNKYGKPYLENTFNIKFNLSHSNEYCLIGINKIDEIGVDIERVNNNILANDIVGNYFSPNEINAFNKLEQRNNSISFFKIWTRKESFIKAVGKGLSIPLHSFDVNLDDENPKIERFEGENDIDKYRLYNILINNKYCASVVNIGQTKFLRKYFIKSLFQI